MEENVLLKEIKGNIGTLTINRPEKRNSLTAGLLFEMIKTLESWAKDESVRLVVITGTGDKAFSGGYDVRSIPTEITAEIKETFRDGSPVDAALAAVHSYPYPTIAMLNGIAVGASFNLAMCCDIRIAADHVRMGIPPAKLGLVYPPDGLIQIVEAIGMARAREIFFTGRIYEPDDLERMGLVHQMVPKSELEKVTYALAEEIAENAPLSLKGIKTILNMLGKSLAFSEQDKKQADALCAQSFFTEDAKEGQKAFLEKRKPVFKGS